MIPGCFGSEAAARQREPLYPFNNAQEASQKGYVLVGVLLLLLAITGVGHTLVMMTRSELFVSRARWEVLTRRLAAEAGLDLTIRGMMVSDSIPRGEWVPMGSAAVPPRARYEARAVRLSPEVLLIQSAAWLDTEPGRDRHVGLYWAMDPMARFSAARGVIESGRLAQVEAGSVVDPSVIHETPIPWPDAFCDRFRPDVDALFTHGLSPRGELHEDPRAELGSQAVSGAVEPRLPSLGLLGHDALMEGAELEVSGTVSPAPIDRFGRCAVPNSTNWGAPTDTSDPCIAYRPLVKSEGSLIVDGGQGQGVLLIAGDAIFRSAARYYGLVLVAGDLEITEESEIHGLVRVRGVVSLRGRSRIVGSACAVLSALGAAEQLRELASIPDSFWPDPP